jgi:hypothetical protein
MTGLARNGLPCGGVAQLVERLLCKQRVVGSIPVASIGVGVRVISGVVSALPG